MDVYPGQNAEGLLRRPSFRYFLVLIFRRAHHKSNKEGWLARRQRKRVQPVYRYHLKNYQSVRRERICRIALRARQTCRDSFLRLYGSLELGLLIVRQYAN